MVSLFLFPSRVIVYVYSQSVVLLSYEELMKEDDIKSQNTRYEFEQIRTDIDLVITEEWKRIWANST